MYKSPYATNFGSSPLGPRGTWFLGGHIPAHDLQRRPAHYVPRQSMWPGVNYGYRPGVDEGPRYFASNSRQRGESMGVGDYGTGKQWRLLRPRIYVDGLAYESPANWEWELRVRGIEY